MAFIEKALDYIVGIVTENEDVKKFPQDFVTASMQWIRSWFLIDDPKTEAKLTDPNRSLDSKKTIIESKLENLSENQTFVQELTEKLASFEQYKARLKNVIDNADIDVKGSVHIGDKGDSSEHHYDEKNIIRGSTIKAGGDFRMGDDVISGNQQVHIVHNHYSSGKSHEKTSAPPTSLKSELKALLAKEKTEEVLDRLLDLSDGIEKDQQETALLLSARFHRTNSQENRGVITSADAGTERNKINAALSRLIDELG